MSNKIYGGYKSFSELCSALFSNAESRDDSFRDIQMWGAPSECADDVYKSADIEFHHIFISAETSPEEFKEELVNRTSEKYAHEFCMYI